MNKINLSEDSALLLQQIEENELEDFDNLVESLRFGRPYTWHLLIDLKQKGLIKFQNSWISLSSKGKKTSRMIWPETPYINYS
jgi:predicted transcriptional regulator